MRNDVPTFDSMPDWSPLERLFPSDTCAEFMHMGRLGSMQLYKHRINRRYLNIDSKTGYFFRYDGKEYRLVSRDEALSHFRG
jgi:hypothetical protein